MKKIKPKSSQYTILGIIFLLVSLALAFDEYITDKTVALPFFIMGLVFIGSSLEKRRNNYHEWDLFTVLLETILIEICYNVLKTLKRYDNLIIY